MKYIQYILITLFVSFNASFLFSQDSTLDTLNVDKMFQIARKKAFGGERKNAREICKLILKKSPGYSDVRILMGRTFEWDGMPDSARAELKKVLSKGYYDDAVNAIIDVETWEGRVDTALYYCNYGLANEPNNETYLIKKAKLLMKKQDYPAANASLRQVLDNINPGNDEAIKLLDDIKIAKISNRIDIGYSNEYFDTSPFFNASWKRSWNIAYVGISHRFRKFGLVNFRSNFGYLSKPGQKINNQFDIDAYPSLFKSNYLYLNYGYSPQDQNFPRHHFGIELFQSLPKAFEASLGMRFLRFYGGINEPSDIYIYTGSIGKYDGNYWFSLRPYLTPDKENHKMSWSLYFTTRRYFKTSDDYFSISLGVGNSPTKLVYNDSLLFNNKIAITFGYSHLFNNKFLLGASIGLYNEQYGELKKRRNEIDSSIKFGYLF